MTPQVAVARLRENPPQWKVSGTEHAIEEPCAPWDSAVTSITQGRRLVAYSGAALFMGRWSRPDKIDLNTVAFLTELVLGKAEINDGQEPFEIAPGASAAVLVEEGDRIAITATSDVRSAKV